MVCEVYKGYNVFALRMFELDTCMNMICHVKPRTFFSSRKKAGDFNEDARSSHLRCDVRAGYVHEHDQSCNQARTFFSSRKKTVHFNEDACENSETMCIHPACWLNSAWCRHHFRMFCAWMETYFLLRSFPLSATRMMHEPPMKKIQHIAYMFTYVYLCLLLEL